MSQLISAQLRFISDIGDKNFAAVAIVFLSGYFLFSQGYKIQSILMLFTLTSAVYSHFLKLIFRQPRPINASPKFWFDTYGFPSSHTVVFTVIFGFLIYLGFKLTGIPLSIRTITIIASLYFICLVGISRVYLGQHYVWDVAAGYVFGALFLIGLIILEQRWK